MLKISVNDCVIKILLILYLIITLLKFFAITTVLVGNILLVLIGSFSLFFCISKKGLKAQKPFIMYVLFYTLAGLLSWIYNGNMNLQELFWPLGFMSFGLLFLNFNISYKTSCFIYCAFCILVILTIFSGGGIASLNTHGSRNAIGMYVILFFSFCLIAAYQNKASVSLLLPVVGLLLCIMAIGRSGIISGFLMCFFFAIFKFEKGVGTRRKIWLLWLVPIIYLLLFVFAYDRFSEFFDSAFLNYERRELESIRMLIWSDYIYKVRSSFSNLLFGAEIADSFWLNAFSQNLHNSFFMLHAKYGILGFILTIYLIIKTLVILFKEKNVYLLIPFLLILFRMNFDYTNFNASLDTILIFYLMVN